MKIFGNYYVGFKKYKHCIYVNRNSMEWVDNHRWGHKTLPKRSWTSTYRYGVGEHVSVYFKDDETFTLFQLSML